MYRSLANLVLLKPAQSTEEQEQRGWVWVLETGNTHTALYVLPTHYSHHTHACITHFTLCMYSNMYIDECNILLFLSGARLAESSPHPHCVSETNCTSHVPAECLQEDGVMLDASGCVTEEQCLYHLFVREDRDLVGGTATDGVMVVRIFPGTHPVAGKAGLDVGEVGQFTLIVPRGIVDIGLQGALQLYLLCRGHSQCTMCSCSHTHTHTHTHTQYTLWV